ncbi:hypothetical protein Hanom_Chr08g00684761 [Helianthus anomalus]
MTHHSPPWLYNLLINFTILTPPKSKNFRSNSSLILKPHSFFYFLLLTVRAC